MIHTTQDKVLDELERGVKVVKLRKGHKVEWGLLYVTILLGFTQGILLN